jgi:hypothetical protein
MSEQASRSSKQKKIELKGERPPGVVGEMDPEKALDVLRRAREERTSEEDERSWRELDRILQEDSV